MRDVKFMLTAIIIIMMATIDFSNKSLNVFVGCCFVAFVAIIPYMIELIQEARKTNETKKTKKQPKKLNIELDQEK